MVTPRKISEIEVLEPFKSSRDDDMFEVWEREKYVGFRYDEVVHRSLSTALNYNCLTIVASSNKSINRPWVQLSRSSGSIAYVDSKAKMLS